MIVAYNGNYPLSRPKNISRTFGKLVISAKNVASLLKIFLTVMLYHLFYAIPSNSGDFRQDTENAFVQDSVTCSRLLM